MAKVSLSAHAGEKYDELSDGEKEEVYEDELLEQIVAMRDDPRATARPGTKQYYGWRCDLARLKVKYGKACWEESVEEKGPIEESHEKLEAAKADPRAKLPKDGEEYREWQKELCRLNGVYEQALRDGPYTYADHEDFHFKAMVEDSELPSFPRFLAAKKLAVVHEHLAMVARDIENGKWDIEGKYTRYNFNKFAYWLRRLKRIIKLLADLPESDIDKPSAQPGPITFPCPGGTRYGEHYLP